MLYLCEKFHQLSQTVFNLQSRHKFMVEMAMFNVQRAITTKVGKPELQFMCSAHHLIALYICVMFDENISDGISVMERTRMIEALTDVRVDGRSHRWTFMWLVISINDT